MSERRAVIIGAGHNGLVVATRLARAGLEPLVLERRPAIGGAVITEEIHPGFRCSTLAHVAYLAPAVFNDLQLRQHGLELVVPDVSLFAPSTDGRALVLSRDQTATVNSIAQFSERDARAYVQFRRTMQKIGSFVFDVLAAAPPDIERSSRSDLWAMLKVGRKLRGLGKEDAYRLMRWAPMPVADFVSEWFESEPLRAAVAASGIFGTTLGPRSAGSTAVLLMQQALGAPAMAHGGLGAITQALGSAARAAGADIRTGAEVRRIDVREGRVTGVTLASGEQIAAPIVISNADPRHTFLGLVDPIDLEPGFLGRMRAYRAQGRMAKINLALAGLPAFAARKSAGTSELTGRIHIGPTLDYLERAFDASKYGEWSPQPYLDITIPSLTDPALAPAGKHVMSICAQFAPYGLRQADWPAVGGAFADAVVETLSQYAPDLKPLIIARQVITPLELETTYGLTGGHIFHGSSRSISCSPCAPCSDGRNIAHLSKACSCAERVLTLGMACPACRA